jgi:hypothetical protein
LRLFGAMKAHGGYRVPWDKLDLTEPQKPRLLCPVKELKSLNLETRMLKVRSPKHLSKSKRCGR